MQLDPQAVELAQTHSYTLGTPRHFTLSNDGKYLYFTRSADGTSVMHSLWRLRCIDGTEELVFDPMRHTKTEHLTAEEEKQRERLRETSAGITSYRLSEDSKTICLPLSGQLWLIDTATLKSARCKHVSGAFDPRFSPDGKRLSFVNGEGLWVVGTGAASKPKLLAGHESAEIFWGRAEFVASEEFERYRGHWWAPDNSRVAATRVDETKVQSTYTISDNPWEMPDSFKYPAAGTVNADVSLYVLDAVSGERQHVAWNNAAFPYLINVQWSKSGLFLTVQSRDQRTLRLLQADESGRTKEILTQTDMQWTDVLQPLPYVDDDGRIIATSGNERRGLTYDGRLVTPEEHHVDDFAGKRGDWILYTASPDPKERVVFAINHRTNELKQLSPSGGVYTAIASKAAIYVTGSTMGSLDRLHQTYDTPASQPKDITIASYHRKPARVPSPEFFTTGPDTLQTSLLLPDKYDQKSPLPVLLQVYGGPHHQEVIYSTRSYAESQWWADQGYAVLSVDGPGTPGRDQKWERQIHGDFITSVAAAQITALSEALERHPVLDKKRVAVRGWSFGGYLSAFLSILYPESIHASISGAPVTDWRLYDTHYTERYLGDPSVNAASYEKSSLVAAAKNASRPILLIHGLQDDNVLPANSLRFLEALSDAHCPHQFLPLSGASHFTKQAEQRAWLLQMELKFLRDNLTD